MRQTRGIETGSLSSDRLNPFWESFGVDVGSKSFGIDLGRPKPSDKGWAAEDDSHHKHFALLRLQRTDRSQSLNPSSVPAKHEFAKTANAKQRPAAACLHLNPSHCNVETLNSPKVLQDPKPVTVRTKNEADGRALTQPSGSRQGLAPSKSSLRDQPEP